MLHSQKNSLLFAIVVGAFLLAVTPFPVQADESLSCDLTRKGNENSSHALASQIVDKESVVKATKDNFALRVSASLTASSFIFVVQDDDKSQRVAFTGAPGALAWDGARLATSSAEFNCRKKSTEPANSIPPVSRTRKSYIVCLLDEGTLEKGAITKVKRLLQTVNSSNTFRLPQKIVAENAEVAFRVGTNQIDPINGLSVELTDKVSGEVAHFAGPPESLKASFVFGFTQGIHDIAAKFLRVGCVYTSEPKLFLKAE